MKITRFEGDITAAPADAICTSTNGRLSLMMGTGGAVRERGGFGVLRACEAIVAERGVLPAGSVHVTTAGRLPYQAILHCVASDPMHRSSDEVIRTCVKNALAAADGLGIKRLAMPVFASGHARFRLERALEVMKSALQSAETAVEEVVIAVLPEEKESEEPPSMFDDDSW